MDLRFSRGISETVGTHVTSELGVVVFEGMNGEKISYVSVYLE